MYHKIDDLIVELYFLWWMLMIADWQCYGDTYPWLVYNSTDDYVSYDSKSDSIDFDEGVHQVGQTHYERQRDIFIC